MKVTTIPSSRGHAPHRSRPPAAGLSLPLISAALLLFWPGPAAAHLGTAGAEEGLRDASRPTLEQAAHHPARTPQHEGGDKSRRPRHLGLTASVLGGYLGILSSEGRGRDASFAYGLRLGVEPRPSFPVELAYVGGGRKAGTTGISSVARHHTLLLLPGWQYRERTAVFGFGAGLALTHARVSHRWIDDGSLTASRTDLGPALFAAFKSRYSVLEIRMDTGAFWRGSQVDLMWTVGVGIALETPEKSRGSH